MTTTVRHYAAKGFTLIELLIVVIIIAILAAIAIPQFSSSSDDAAESAMGANLSTMRSAIELYRVQHTNTYPSRAPTGAAPACEGDAGSVVDNNATTMDHQLTRFSNAAGHTCTVRNANYPLGPYLRAMPTEPVTNSATVLVVTAAATTPPGAATTGWRFVNTTGQFQVNSTRVARDGNTPLANK